MRGGTPTWSIARRAASVAVVVVAGLMFVAGCGSDKPAEGTGSTGTVGAGPSGTDQAASPGATNSVGSGSGDGGSSGDGGGPGDGGSPGGGATASKPCAVVTNADANQALGASATNTLDSETECLYEADTSAVMFSVTTEAYDPASVDMLTMLGPAVQKLDGIGDAAFKVSLGIETQFHVWIKGKYVALIVTKESGDTETPGRQLLDKVLSRI